MRIGFAGIRVEGSRIGKWIFRVKDVWGTKLNDSNPKARLELREDRR